MTGTTGENTWARDGFDGRSGRQLGRVPGQVDQGPDLFFSFFFVVRRVVINFCALCYTPIASIIPAGSYHDDHIWNSDFTAVLVLPSADLPSDDDHGIQVVGALKHEERCRGTGPRGIQGASWMCIAWRVLKTSIRHSCEPGQIYHSRLGRISPNEKGGNL